MTLDPLSLAITGLGAVTAVGHSAPETFAAIRAGIAGFGDHPWFDVETKDPGWDPKEMLTAAMVSTCDPAIEGRERLVELSVTALKELVRNTSMRRADLDRTALLMALPVDDDVVRGWQLGATFAGELCSRAGLPLLPERHLDQSGHTAVFNLLHHAERLLGTRGISRCILLAAETFHDEARLALLDERFRMRSERAVDGYMPGEGAVAVMIERPDGPHGELARIAGITHGDEPHPLTSELSSTGRGLGTVLRALLPNGGGQPWLVCDLNGESYRSFEWGLMLTRLSPELDSVARLDHPADCVGDVGAAMGGILLAHCARAFERGYAPNDRALLFAAPDGPARVGVVVERGRRVQENES